MTVDTQHLGTRERILALLHEGKTVTVHGLSRDWGLTRADLRYHLTLLVQEGLAEIVPRDPALPARRGRPVLRYRLAVHLAPNNLPGLCSALLELILASHPEEQRKHALNALAEQMAVEPPTSPSLTQRLTQTVAFLNQRAYQSRWEASPTGPRLLLRNCPYAAILASYPELCQLDRLLLERLAGVALKQIQRQNLATGSPPACIFVSQALPLV